MKTGEKSESGSSYSYESISSTNTSPWLQSLRYYRRTGGKTVLFAVLCVLTLGGFYLATRWFLKVKVWARYKECRVREADVVVVQLTEEVMVETNTRRALISQKALSRGDSAEPSEVLLCDIQSETYILNEESDMFEPLSFPTRWPYQQIHREYGAGLMDEDVISQRQQIYGKCVMDVPVPSYFEVFSHEVLHPFFIFQLFSITVWLIEAYYIYAGVIFAMSLTSIVVTVITTRENFMKIREMAYYETNVTMLTGNAPHFSQTLSASSRLVPGMLISIPHDWTAPCDLLLLSGNCVMNEGLLTGESMPILKDPLPKVSATPFDKDNEDKHLIFAGTRCIQVRGTAIGLVISTGFATAKGEIVRSILFPKPTRLDFNQDSMKFVGILACIAVVAFLISLIPMVVYKEGAFEMITKSLDLVTIAIPPALPLAMTIGITFAMHRLKQQNIVCIAPSAINAAGSVSVVCCDKTGTLTEDSMKFHGALSGDNHSFDKFTRSKADLPVGLLSTLSCCQSLTVIDGEVVGDPQESSLFKEMDLQFEEENGRRRIVVPGKTLEVVQMFYFSSALKRMGVVALDPTTGVHCLYMKGAPEIIRKLCQSVPDNFSQVVFQHSRQGLRILACGHKLLPDYSPTDSLQQMESGLTFDGLVMFHNQLMSETPDVVSALQLAGYQIVVSTGDNMLTGLAVAYDSGIVPTLYETYVAEFDHRSGKLRWEKHSGEITKVLPEGGDVEWIGRMQSGDTDFAIALSGKTLMAIASNDEFAQMMPAILRQLRVCGRMSPKQKSILVEKYQEIGHIVAMCGDGANDCGALKSADVGLSVSFEESSIAAPFTARSIPSITTLFREGKAALATSYQCFKFMAMYAMIQLITATILYTMDSNLMNIQYLFIDLFLVVPLTYVMGDFAAYPLLTPDQLPRKLLSVPILVSFFGQMVVQTLFLLLTYLLELTQNWYSHDGEGMLYPVAGDDNTVLFLVSIFQYLAVCFAFSIGPPFRVPMYTNLQFMCVLVTMTLVNLYLLLFPAEWTRDLLEVRAR